LVVNGFFPNVSIKDIMGPLLDKIVQHKGTLGTLSDQVNIVRDYLLKERMAVYIFIHNIDGKNLCNEKTQTLLASLAGLSCIRMVATVDQINASLLWDTTKQDMFRFIWHDATTFTPYLVETTFENSMLAQQNGELGMQGMQHVLASLTLNARKIFALLGQHQLSKHAASVSLTKKKTSMSPVEYGWTYQEFYRRAHEAFLVSNPVSFKTQLTEYKDHQMIKTVKASDGSDVLYIPLETHLLEQVLEQME
jgi:origin recognition complex subunit 2